MEVSCASDATEESVVCHRRCGLCSESDPLFSQLFFDPTLESFSFQKGRLPAAWRIVTPGRRRLAMMCDTAPAIAGRVLPGGDFSIPSPI